MLVRRAFLAGVSALGLMMGLEGPAAARRRKRRRSGTQPVQNAPTAPTGAVKSSAGLFNLEGLSLPSPRFVTAPGRLRKGATGWERAPADGARSYGSGILLEGAERISSARWDRPEAAAALSGAGLQTVGTHGTADLFGTTGKCTLLTDAGRVTAPGLAARAAAGVPCRVLLTFHIERGSGPSSLLLRLSQNGTDAPQHLALDFAADGSLTSAVRRGGGRPVALNWGADLLDTLGGGRKVYTSWVDVDATQGGDVMPLIVFSGGGQLAIHAINMMVDPRLQRPSLIPVLEDGDCAADRIDFGGSSAAVEVEFEGLAMGRTRTAASNVTVPDFLAAPALPLETRITLRPASATAALDFLLPSERWELDAWPARAGADRTVILGPGYFEYGVALGSFPQPTTKMGTYTIKGAFTDPARWPQVKGLVANGSRISKLALINVCLFSRTSKGVQNNELGMQTPLLTASTQGFVADHFRMRGCNIAHSRSWADAGFWVQEEDGRDQLWFGKFNTPVLPDGFDWQMSDGEISHICNGQTISAADRAHRGRYVQEGVYSHDIVVDHINTGRGVIDWVFRNNIYGRSTNLVGSGYQSEAPIEVDIGRGRVPLPASGISAEKLPVNRLFTLYGRRESGTSPVIAAPDANWTLRVTGWEPGNQLRGAEDGHAFFASIPASAKDGGAQMERDLAVWVHKGNGPASPANPHIYVTTQLGKRDAAGAYQRSKLPAAGSARLHSDCIQVNGQGGTFNMEISGNLFLSEGQTMLFGGTSSSGADPTRFERLALDRNIVCSGAFDACAIYGLPVANADVRNTIILPVSSKRMQNGFGWFSASGEGVTMTLTNCWVGVNNQQGTANFTGKRVMKGAVINGDPKPIACNWRNPEGKMQMARERSILPQLTDMVPPEFLDKNGLVKAGQASDRTFHFTAAAEKLTGIPLNRTLSEARGYAHKDFGGLNALLARFDRTPDRSVTVTGEATQAGEAILSGVRGKGFDRLYGGNTRGLFTLSGGTLRAAAALDKVDEVFLLVTDAGEHLLVDVR